MNINTLFLFYLNSQQLINLFNIYHNPINYYHKKEAKKILIKNYQRLAYYYIYKHQSLNKNFINSNKHNIDIIVYKSLIKAFNNFNYQDYNVNTFKPYLKKVVNAYVSSYLAYEFIMNIPVNYPLYIKQQLRKLYFIKKRLNISLINKKNIDLMASELKKPVNYIIFLLQLKYKHFYNDFELLDNLIINDKNYNENFNYYKYGYVNKNDLYFDLQNWILNS